MLDRAKEIEELLGAVTVAESAQRPSATRSTRACTGRRSRAPRPDRRGCNPGRARTVERRGEQQQLLFLAGAPGAPPPRPSRARRAPDWRLRTAPPKTELWSRCGTRRCSPSPADCHRRSSRAGTSHRPTRRSPAPPQRLVVFEPALHARGILACAAASSLNATSVAHRNQPSQTLSPRPCEPTVFMPSFQSPLPNSGSPWAPTARLASKACAQCSYSEAVRSDSPRLKVRVARPPGWLRPPDRAPAHRAPPRRRSP